MTNVKILSLTLMMYAADHDDKLPPAGTWVDATSDYASRDGYYPDPSVENRKEDEYGFAFFEPVSLVGLDTITKPEGVPLVFQSVLMGRNAHSDLRTLPRIPRSFRGKEGLNYVAFCDGHVKGFPPTWPGEPIVIELKK
jgi:prepilin-type processing-associated H-X9-DG protein